MRDVPLLSLANIMHRAGDLDSKLIFHYWIRRTPKRRNAFLLFHSGLYHDAIIATNLALQLSPDLVVSQVAIQPAPSFLFRQISFSSS